MYSMVLVLFTFSISIVTLSFCVIVFDGRPTYQTFFHQDATDLDFPFNTSV